MPVSRHVTKSADETLELGKKTAESLKKGDVVALVGGLGSGKTVFAKGLALGLGIKEDLTSPTFTLLRQYQGRFELCHFDLYRIEDEQELEHIGLYDCAGGDNVCIIEWAQHAQRLFPTFCVCFSGSGSDERAIEIKEGKDAHTGC